jgi:hypothetical protein
MFLILSYLSLYIYHNCFTVIAYDKNKLIVINLLKILIT